MAMDYFNYLKAKARLSTAEKSQTPVLTDEDEAFLNRVASPTENETTDTNVESQEHNPPISLPTEPSTEPSTEPTAELPPGRNAQIALMDGAQDIALPLSPPPIEESKRLGTEETDKGKQKENTPSQEQKKADLGRRKSKITRPWSWFKKNSTDGKEETQDKAVEKPAKITKENEHEAKEEEEDLTVVLERLNLAAVNNRVFSISDETQELLKKFNLIFKDLIRGVPTAYDDLENLLTNGDKQLRKTFDNMPAFLQKLIQSLPDKVTQNLAPEMLAVAAEKAGRSGIDTENAGKAAAAAAAKKMGLKVPSLKDLVAKPAALTGMLRSIMTFLRARFPAFMGMNVLWSLALFLLLFVLWYCHKRGREVRLENERLLTEQEVARLEAEYAAVDAKEQLTTTAPEGASMEQVEQGIRDAQQARDDLARNLEEGVDIDSNAAGRPYHQRQAKKSLSKGKKSDKIEPYPGT